MKVRCIAEKSFIDYNICSLCSSVQICFKTCMKKPNSALCFIKLCMSLTEKNTYCPNTLYNLSAFFAHMFASFCVTHIWQTPKSRADDYAYPRNIASMNIYIVCRFCVICRAVCSRAHTRTQAFDNDETRLYGIVQTTNKPFIHV